MTLHLHRKRLKGSKDIRIVDRSGEDVGRVNNDGHIIYPGEEGLRIVQSVNACERMREEVEGLHTELRRYRRSAKDLKPIDLRPLTRNSDALFTHVTLEDCDLRGALKKNQEDSEETKPWLQFGRCNIDRAGDHTPGRLTARLRDGITDFEHDSAYALQIPLIGLEFRLIHNHVSHFTAYIAPSPVDIKIHDPSWVPEEQEGSVKCESCEDGHLIVPEGFYVPPMYECAHVVAGKRIGITMGPVWDWVEKNGG